MTKKPTLKDIEEHLSKITVINDKQRQLELCMRNITRHAFGNTRYTLDLQAQYEYLMQEGSEVSKSLINSILKYRGMILD